MTSAPDRLLVRVRSCCLALPEVTEGVTHGAPTWYVRRRSFAKFVDPAVHPRLEERHVALWAAAPPGDRRSLTSADPDRFFAPRFGGSDWIGIRLDLAVPVDWDEVTEVVTEGYRVAAPATLIARLADPR